MVGAPNPQEDFLLPYNQEKKLSIQVQATHLD